MRVECWRCDRCGEEYMCDGPEIGSGFAVVSDAEGEELDLCPDCDMALSKWLEGPKPKRIREPIDKAKK